MTSLKEPSERSYINDRAKVGEQDKLIMVNPCVAGGYSNTAHPGVSLYKFPKNPTLRRQWEKQVRGHGRNGRQQKVRFFVASILCRIASMRERNLLQSTELLGRDHSYLVLFLPYFHGLCLRHPMPVTVQAKAPVNDRLCQFQKLPQNVQEWLQKKDIE